jgi:hypothetical protein
MEAGQITNTANSTENKTAATQSKNPAQKMPVLQNRNAHHPRSIRKAWAAKAVFIGKTNGACHLKLRVRELL